MLQQIRKITLLIVMMMMMMMMLLLCRDFLLWISLSRLVSTRNRQRIRPRPTKPLPHPFSSAAATLLLAASCKIYFHDVIFLHLLVPPTALTSHLVLSLLQFALLPHPPHSNLRDSQQLRPRHIAISHPLSPLTSTGRMFGLYQRKNGMKPCRKRRNSLVLARLVFKLDNIQSCGSFAKSFSSTW